MKTIELFESLNTDQLEKLKEQIMTILSHRNDAGLIYVKNLHLSQRSLYLCRTLNVETLQDLARRKFKDIKGVRGCGKFTIIELSNRLEKYGFKEYWHD